MSLFDYYTKYDLEDLKRLLKDESLSLEDKEAIKVAIRLKENPLSRYPHPLKAIHDLYVEETKHRTMDEEEFMDLKLIYLLKAEEAKKSLEDFTVSQLREELKKYPPDSPERVIIIDAIERKIKKEEELESEKTISEIEKDASTIEYNRKLAELNKILADYFGRMGEAWKQYSSFVEEFPVFTDQWAEVYDQVSQSDEKEAFEVGVWNLKWGLPIENHMIRFTPEKADVIERNLIEKGRTPSKDWYEAVRLSKQRYYEL